MPVARAGCATSSSTIQAEQDRIIRSPLPGVLVVEGGPGSGKTAVAPAPGGLPALHPPRPDRAQRGARGRPEPPVPALHQPGPSLARGVQRGPGDAGAAVSRGGGRARRSRTPSRCIKGDLRMAEVVAAAIRNRQRVPDSARQLTGRGRPGSSCTPRHGRRGPRPGSRLTEAAQPGAPDVRHLAARSARAGRWPRRGVWTRTPTARSCWPTCATARTCAAR